MSAAAANAPKSAWMVQHSALEPMDEFTTHTELFVSKSDAELYLHLLLEDHIIADHGLKAEGVRPGKMFMNRTTMNPRIRYGLKAEDVYTKAGIDELDQAGPHYWWYRIKEMPINEHTIVIESRLRADSVESNDEGDTSSDDEEEEVKPAVSNKKRKKQ